MNEVVKQAKRLFECHKELTSWKQEDGKEKWAALSKEHNLLLDREHCVLYAKTLLEMEAKLDDIKTWLAEKDMFYD